MLLTSIPSPDIATFEVGPFVVRFYALCILVGILAACAITNRRLTKRGGESGVVVFFAMLAVVLGIIGARIYHVLTHWGDFFGPHADQQWWAIWNGGIAIFGSLLGGAVGVAIACRISGIRFWSFADALAPALLVAQACGRLGNWFNHELFGTPTTLPWGLEIYPGNPHAPIGLPADTLYHPTFLYEILWNLLGVFVLLWLERKLHMRWGRAFGFYLIWYGLGRFLIEGMRLDPSLSILFWRVNQFTALIAIVLGVILIIVQKLRHTGRELSVYRPGRARPGKSVLAQTADSDKYFHIFAHPGATAAADTASQPSSDADASANVSEDAPVVASGQDDADNVDHADTDADAAADAADADTADAAQPQADNTR